MVFFSRCTRAEKWRYVSPLYLQGELAMYLWASREAGGFGGGHSQRADFHSYLQMYSDEVFFIFSVADTTTE